MSNKTLLKLIASSNFITFNKTIAKTIGIDEAILFGSLCSFKSLFNDADEFFCEQERLVNDTCLTAHRIRNAQKNLVAYGLLEITKKGLPAKNYFKLNEENIIKLLENDNQTLRTSGGTFDSTGTIKSDSTGNSKSDTSFINNKTTNNQSINKEEKKVSKKEPSGFDNIINSNFENEQVKNAMYEFIKMRKLIKKPMTDYALKRLISELKKLSSNTEKQIKILDQSIMNNWQGIYALKTL